MTIVAHSHSFVVGVDTHARHHVYAVVATGTGELVDTRGFPTTIAGIKRALAWVGRLSGADLGVLWVVEGAATYGMVLAGIVEATGYMVVEAPRMSRRAHQGVGKSDTLDAARIGHAVLALEPSQLRQPWMREGAREALPHRARRGRYRRFTTGTSHRIKRCTPKPQGLSDPRHTGHISSRPKSWDSTASGSWLTVSNSPTRFALERDWCGFETGTGLVRLLRSGSKNPDQGSIVSLTPPTKNVKRPPRKTSSPRHIVRQRSYSWSSTATHNKRTNPLRRHRPRHPTPPGHDRSDLAQL